MNESIMLTSDEVDELKCILNNYMTSLDPYDREAERADDFVTLVDAKLKE